MDNYKVYDILNKKDQLRNLKFSNSNLPRHWLHYFSASNSLFSPKQLEVNLIIGVYQKRFLLF